MKVTVSGTLVIDTTEDGGTILSENFEEPPNHAALEKFIGQRVEISMEVL